VHRSLLDVLRCPFCGSTLELVEHGATLVTSDQVERGVLGCQCCAFPVVAGIPVMIADAASRSALVALDEGRVGDALIGLLAPGADPDRQQDVGALVASEGVTYRSALELLCDDEEGTYFLYRFSDPTYVTAEGLLRAIAESGWPLEGRTLDLCGGSGHLTRALASLRSAETDGRGKTVLADVHFWKLWLALRFNAPDADPVCCNANHPLPFARATFSTVLLADAFPYIWHKRLAAEEMMRLAGEDGVVVMPHLHSALGDNFSAGDTLTPEAYRALFEPLGPRLFSDRRLFDDLVERGVVDLTASVSPEALGDEPELTLIATTRSELFRRYALPAPGAVDGRLAVNPLYRVDANGSSSKLTLEFPTPEYEEEFGACRRYLPETLTVEADLTAPIEPERLGPACEELRSLRVLIDAPAGYAS